MVAHDLGRVCEKRACVSPVVASPRHQGLSGAGRWKTGALCLSWTSTSWLWTLQLSLRASERTPAACRGLAVVPGQNSITCRPGL